MPAVTYRIALDTMAQHGDEVVDVLRESGCFDEGFFHLDEHTDFASFACRLLSAAVELWAATVVASYKLTLIDEEA